MLSPALLAGRDRYERDLELLSRVRASYSRQAGQPGWIRIDGQRGKDEVSADVTRAAAKRLSQP